ncbi:hypothetical protein CRG98_040712 [Punica granatum]|uniref:Uncharacterized protein n=1 Tax=Punica granatum TaxID=22663 RepID=A0A2I0I4F9_PUNGR|nr:hypothetical protein CRG98_040712 [Punica granatum]
MVVPRAPGGILMQDLTGHRERNGYPGGSRWYFDAREKGEKWRWCTVERLSARDHLVTGESEGHEEPLGSDGTTCHSREATPYSLVYGVEAILPIEVEIPSMRVLAESELEEAEWAKQHYEQLNLIDEKRLTTLCNDQCYQQRMARAFNARVRHCEFNPGDLILRKVLHITSDSRDKFTYKYDGPFVVRETFSGGAIILSDMDRTENALPVNADALKKLHARFTSAHLLSSAPVLFPFKSPLRAKNNFSARSKTFSRWPRQKLGNEGHGLKSRKGEPWQKESTNHILARLKTRKGRSRQKLEEPRGAIGPYLGRS